MTQHKNKLAGGKRMEALAALEGSSLSVPEAAEADAGTDSLLAWNLPETPSPDVLLALQQTNARLAQQLAERTAELQALSQSLSHSEARLGYFIENAPVAIAMFDREMHYLAASRRWLQEHGLAGRQVLGSSHYEMFPEFSGRWRERHLRGLAGEVLHENEDRQVLADGSVQWLKWELRPWFNTAGRIGGVVIFTEDITARQHAEQALRSTNRTLQAIRDCHEAMLRVKTEQELLDETCRIIVAIGGERMAWVGYAQTDVHQRVQPVAQAGVSAGHLRHARITWADVPRGRGPVGTAIRTGKPCLCRSTQTDPDFALWRDSALKHGYGSVLGLPLLAENACFGALAIYAPEPDAFDPGEQLLLKDLANDLAFGISNLRLRAERERLEQEILQSIEREQERIGRDLHDGLGQLLVGAKFRSVYLQKISAPGSAAAVEAGLLEESLNQAIKQARDLATGLNPVQVAPAGLTVSLQKLADDVTGTLGVHCVSRLPKTLKVHDYHVAYQLYRIAQEAVQNALKHSGAGNIYLTLAQAQDELRLTVEDDGKGMPRKPKRTGMGLHNLRTRAKLIGGRLEIRPRKTGGTVVSCVLAFPETPTPA